MGKDPTELGRRVMKRSLSFKDLSVDKDLIQ